jgi:hypothetical protein
MQSREIPDIWVSHLGNTVCLFCLRDFAFQHWMDQPKQNAYRVLESSEVSEPTDCILGEHEISSTGRNWTKPNSWTMPFPGGVAIRRRSRSGFGRDCGTR